MAAIHDNLRQLRQANGWTQEEVARQMALTRQAEEELQELERLGFGGLPVCIAKTQYSLSDDPEKLGAPQNFTITIRSLRVCAGAGFVVAMAGDILTMPGLPKHPAAEKIDVTQQGNNVRLI